MDYIMTLMKFIIAVGILAVVDAQLPIHGFGDLQASREWQGIKLIAEWVILPSLVLLLRDAVKDYGQTNQPTNQVGQEPTAIQLYQPDQPDDQPTDPTVTVEPTNQPTMFPLPYSDIPEPADLSDEVKRSVYAFARWGSNKAAGEYLKKDPETIRKNMIKARDKYPDWVSVVLQEERK